MPKINDMVNPKNDFNPEDYVDIVGELENNTITKTN